MKFILPTLAIALLLPSASFAETGLVIINGKNVNLRSRPAPQSEVVSQASLYTIYKADTTPQAESGLSWYRLLAVTDGSHLESIDGYQEAFVSTGLARVVPAEAAGIPSGRPAPATLHFNLPKKLPVPAGIDAARLEAGLSMLVRHYNAAIDRCAASAPVFSDALFLPNREPLEQLRIGDLGEVFSPLEPLVKMIIQALDKCDWNEARMHDHLPPEASSLITLLDSLGMRIVMPEGDVSFDWTSRAIRERLMPYFTDDMKDWIAFRSTQPEWLSEDAGLSVELEEVAAWALQTERFIASHRGSLYRRTAEDRYADLCEVLMFCRMDNTQTFGEEGGTIHPDWLATLEKTAADNPGTRLGTVLARYIRDVKSSGLHQPEGLEQIIMKQVRAAW